MWGYFVLGVIIGALMFMLFYCIWSFVDDCHTTQNAVLQIDYRTDSLRCDLNQLRNRVSLLERHTKEVEADAHSGTDASGYSDAVPEQPDVAEEGSEHA